MRTDFVRPGVIKVTAEALPERLALTAWTAIYGIPRGIVFEGIELDFSERLQNVIQKGKCTLPKNRIVRKAKK